MTFGIMTFSIMAFSITLNNVMLSIKYSGSSVLKSVIMLNVVS
jgi:hypothetical protein